MINAELIDYSLFRFQTSGGFRLVQALVAWWMPKLPKPWLNYQAISRCAKRNRKEKVFSFLLRSRVADRRFPNKHSIIVSRCVIDVCLLCEFINAIDSETLFVCFPFFDLQATAVVGEGGLIIRHRVRLYVSSTVGCTSMPQQFFRREQYKVN